MSLGQKTVLGQGLIFRLPLTPALSVRRPSCSCWLHKRGWLTSLSLFSCHPPQVWGDTEQKVEGTITSSSHIKIILYNKEGHFIDFCVLLFFTIAAPLLQYGLSSLFKNTFSKCFSCSCQWGAAAPAHSRPLGRTPNPFFCRNVRLW